MADGVEPTAEELRVTYGAMSEVELIDIAHAYDDLGPEAQIILRAEFAQRELEPPLVGESEEVSDETRPKLRQLVTVERFRDLTWALPAQSVLEANGIPALLLDTNLIRLHWGLSNFVGGIRLQVDAENEANAKEVLTAPIPQSFDVGDGTLFLQPACPRCGSLHVMADNLKQKFVAWAYLTANFLVPAFLVIIAFLPNDVWKCENCGCRWTDDHEVDHRMRRPFR